MATHLVQPIVGIAAFIDRAGHVGRPIGRNDVMTQGYSQLGCYQPLFGYALVYFPAQN
jgi:hypothetical protein